VGFRVTLHSIPDRRYNYSPSSLGSSMPTILVDKAGTYGATFFEYVSESQMSFAGAIGIVVELVDMLLKLRQRISYLDGSEDPSPYIYSTRN